MGQATDGVTSVSIPVVLAIELSNLLLFEAIYLSVIAKLCVELTVPSTNRPL